jgi:hypothetical protein
MKGGPFDRFQEISGDFKQSEANFSDSGAGSARSHGGIQKLISATASQSIFLPVNGWRFPHNHALGWRKDEFLSL